MNRNLLNLNPSTRSVQSGSSQPRRVRHLVWLVCVALVVTFLPMAAPAPAAAAPAPRLIRIQQASASDSTAIKSVVLTCPTGYKTLGGGGWAEGPSGTIALLGVMPNAPLTSATITASEVLGGTASAWRLHGYATCWATSTRSVQLVSATTPRDSSATKRAIVECPTGTDLVGVMGGVSTGAYGKLALSGFQPSSKQGLAMGRELADGTTANWSVTAHAICMKAGSLRGLDQVLNVSSVDSSSFRSASAPCPDGKTVISGGATVWNPDGAYAREVVLSNVSSWTNGKGAYAIASETINGTSNTWYAVAYAICMSN